MLSLAELRTCLWALAKVCDAKVILLDREGNLIECVDTVREGISIDDKKLAKVYELVKGKPISCNFYQNKGGILSLLFKDFILVIDCDERFLEEQRFIEQFKSMMPLIATTVGGVADICDEKGNRIFSCDSDGKVYQRKTPYSKDGHISMLERRPVIGASNRVKGAIAIRFPISKHYGLGFNNENSVKAHAATGPLSR